MEEVVDETRIVAMEVAHVKCRVQWPESLADEEYLSDRAVSSCDYSGRINHRDVVEIGHSG